MVPLWLLLITILFAMAGLWLVLIVPLLRGYWYRRRQATLRKLDEQLEFGLSDYALASRSEWRDRLLNDPEVLKAIESVVDNSDEPIDSVRERARRNADEIVPFFSTRLYFRFGYWVGRWLLRMMYWVHADYSDRQALADIDRNSCVVLVSNHRSNIDPFLLIYLASKRTAISYSAGEWALGWPVRHLLHAIGFYIIRRDGGGDGLYRTLVERYVYLAASRCVPQGLFLEGALSRNGEMQPLKLGLLNYVLKAHGQGNCKDIVFVPVGLSYDRILEDTTLVDRELKRFAGKGRLYPLLSLGRFLVLMMPRMVGLGKPYGKVVANFGSPLSLNNWQGATGQSLDSSDPDCRRATVSNLGDELAQRIERLIPVLPVALLACVLLARGAGGVSELRLIRDALVLAESLRAESIPVFMDSIDEDRLFSQALYMLLKRRLVELSGDGQLRFLGNAQLLLEYYRNVIPAQLRLSPSDQTHTFSNDLSRASIGSNLKTKE